MAVSLKKRSLGELISLTFRIAFSNFFLLFLIALVFQIPQLLVQLSASTLGPKENETMEFVGAGLLLILSFFLGPLQQASMMQIIADAYTEGRARLGKSLKVGLKRFLPLLVFSLLFGLLIGLGFMLLLIPGLFFLAAFAVGAPALVVEGLGPIEAFQRSAELTKGSRWKVLFFLLILYLIMILIGAGLGAILHGTQDTMAEKSTPTMVFSWAFGVLGSIFFLAGPVILYFQLRIERENLDVQKLTELVDRIGEKRQGPRLNPLES